MSMSMIKMDRPDNLQAFAAKIREHFMQFDRCRSRIIKCGSYYFFEKVPAENMVEILDEASEEECIRFMEKTQTEPFAEGFALHKVYLVPDGD
jgi:hypothetical protein